MSRKIPASAWICTWIPFCQTGNTINVLSLLYIFFVILRPLLSQTPFSIGNRWKNNILNALKRTKYHDAVKQRFQILHFLYFSYLHFPRSEYTYSMLIAEIRLYLLSGNERLCNVLEINVKLLKNSLFWCCRIIYSRLVVKCYWESIFCKGYSLHVISLNISYKNKISFCLFFVISINRYIIQSICLLSCWLRPQFNKMFIVLCCWKSDTKLVGSPFEVHWSALALNMIYVIC